MLLKSVTKGHGSRAAYKVKGSRLSRRRAELAWFVFLKWASANGYPTGEDSPAVSAQHDGDHDVDHGAGRDSDVSGSIDKANVTAAEAPAAHDPNIEKSPAHRLQQWPGKIVQSNGKIHQDAGGAQAPSC